MKTSFVSCLFAASLLSKMLSFVSLVMYRVSIIVIGRKLNSQRIAMNGNATEKLERAFKLKIPVGFKCASR